MNKYVKDINFLIFILGEIEILFLVIFIQINYYKLPDICFVCKNIG
jgi:hypothetical protein